MMAVEAESALPGDARWIGCGGPGDGTVRFKREIALDAPVSSAVLRYAGLGIAYASVNGAAVSDAVLDPPFTAYHKRIPVQAVEVGRLLRPGENHLAVEVGNGWFNVRTPTVWRWHEAAWTGSPRLIAELVVTFLDGRTETVVTDEAWSARGTPTVFNDVYAGETYDARLRDDLPAPCPAMVTDPPAG